MKIKWNLEPSPNVKEHYLITDHNGILQIAYWSDSDLFGNPSGIWRWTGVLQYTKVVAWMPLPEPYSKK